MDSAETEVDDAIHEISEHCKSVEKVKLSPVILIRVTPLDDEPDVFVQVCLPSGYGVQCWTSIAFWSYGTDPD